MDKTDKKMGFLRNTTAAKPLDAGDKKSTISRSGDTASSNSSSGRNLGRNGSRRVRNKSAASPLPSTTSKLGASHGTLRTGDTDSVSTGGSDSVRSGNSKASRYSKISTVSSLSASTFGTTASSSIMMSPPPMQKRSGARGGKGATRSPLPRVPRPPTSTTSGSGGVSQRDIVGGSSSSISNSSKGGGFKSPKFGKKLAVQPLHLSPLPGEKTPSKKTKKKTLSPKINRLSSRNKSSSNLSSSSSKKKQVTFSTEFAIFTDDAQYENDHEDDNDVAPPPTQPGIRRESWGIKELSFDIKNIANDGKDKNDEDCLWFTSYEVERRNQIDNKVIEIMNESKNLSNIQNDDNIKITLDHDDEYDDDDEFFDEGGGECIRGLENQTIDGSQRTDHSRRASRDAVFEEQHHSNGDIESISKAYILCTQLALHRAQELGTQDETYVMEHVLGGGGGGGGGTDTDSHKDDQKNHQGRKHRHHRSSN